MNHENIIALLGSYVDGEVAAVQRRDITAHLGDCPACAARYAELLAVRNAVHSVHQRRGAPAALRDRMLRAARDAEAGASRTPARGRRWSRTIAPVFALAAALLIVVSGTRAVTLRQAADHRVMDDVLGSHVRSLITAHAMDVVSTDQHTVKPWFNGKLDFSPTVDDFAGRGYPLLGGRVDYVDHRRVAVLVYGRRQHLINVYLWPESAGNPEVQSDTRQGYHLLHWAAGGYAYWVASDLGTAELDEFAGLVRQSAVNH